MSYSGCDCVFDSHGGGGGQQKKVSSVRYDWPLILSTNSYICGM